MDMSDGVLWSDAPSDPPSPPGAPGPSSGMTTPGTPTLDRTDEQGGRSYPTWHVSPIVSLDEIRRRAQWYVNESGKPEVIDHSDGNLELITPTTQQGAPPA